MHTIVLEWGLRLSKLQVFARTSGECGLSKVDPLEVQNGNQCKDKHAVITQEPSLRSYPSRAQSEPQQKSREPSDVRVELKPRPAPKPNVVPCREKCAGKFRHET